MQSFFRSSVTIESILTEVIAMRCSTFFYGRK